MGNKTFVLLIFSIASNVLLGLCYFKCHHHKMPFGLYDGVGESLKKAETVRRRDTDNVSQEYDLRAFPKLKNALEGFHDGTDSTFNDFIRLADSLRVKGAPSKGDLAHMASKQRETARYLFAWYGDYLWSVQDDGRPHVKEIENIIKHLPFSQDSLPIYHMRNIMGLSPEGRLAAATALVNDIHFSREMILHDIWRIFSGKNERYYRFFPVHQTGQTHVKAGGVLETRLMVGHFRKWWERGDEVKSYMNGQEMIQDKEGKIMVSIPAGETGRFSLEFVTVWSHRHSPKEYRDTVFFEYEVVR